MSQRRKERRRSPCVRMRGEISSPVICALLLAVAGCGLVGWSVTRSPNVDHSRSMQLPTEPDVPTPQYETRAIRDIRTGHRVMADNPELSGEFVHELDIDPATWRNVSLQMTKEDQGLLNIVLLRPLDWLDAYGCEVGGTVHLDLEEFGAVGPAEVLSIDPCPPIENGPGRVVTATFDHSSADILDIHVERLSQPIGTTANHPFWSEDRQSFIAAGSLDIGEQLLLADGSQAAVLSIAPRIAAEPVYNLEVDGEHVYCVSPEGILVHNSCVDRAAAAARRFGGELLEAGHYRFPNRQAARQAASEIAGNMGRDTIPIRLSAYRGAPARMKDSMRVIGRQSADGGTWWRDDFLGHSRLGAGPHVNVRVDGFNFHLWY